MRTQTFALAMMATLVLAGCATKKYVKDEVGTSEQRLAGRVEQVESQVEAAQTRLQEHEEKISQTSKTAQEALDRAVAAGKLAQGKLLYEVVLTDERVRFGFERADLSDEAKAALDEFAARLKGENKNVYIEIQGHTDSTGPEEYNHKLGLERAEAVRRYLNMQHSLPLHRMSVISYGESAPIADNGTREGRAQNRRVALVVLE